VRWQPSFNYDSVRLDHSATPADFYDARSEKDARGFPADPLYWESIVVDAKFGARELRSISVYPVDLGFGRPRSQRGRPLLAGDNLTGRILARIKRLSASFGTRMEIENGVGVIKL
jgi:poly-gamma-glutamate synthesis protein (capsule biosynthesis protein)